MAEGCLFCAMASGDMSVAKLYDDDLVFAIRDINPRAPVHLLIIPRAHISDAREVDERTGAVLGRMFAVAAQLAEAEHIRNRGYRLAFNVGEEAGMTIPHLHMHLVGGRHLGAEG
ncbi:MAG TPA: HIT domain-containing protein [Dehalococcoidia bacterium]|jgi:histidine triad (HIT) family protein|nr:HIT domain-containing protein [Dehalococcoidia bacterium]